MKKMLAAALFAFGSITLLATLYWAVADKATHGAAAAVIDQGFLRTVMDFVLCLMVAAFSLLAGYYLWRENTKAGEKSAKNDVA